MASITYKLYVITIRYQTIAIIPAKNPIDATNKYFAKIGFDSDYSYFCSHLITTIFTVNASRNRCKTKTIDGGFIRISSYQATSCDDVFEWIGTDNINNGLFIWPTIEEVRECIGFSNAPEYELRKFCI